MSSINKSPKTARREETGATHEDQPIAGGNAREAGAQVHHPFHDPQ
jgi:hypothetical protein